MSTMGELRESLLGLFSEPPDSILSSVLVNVTEILRGDAALLPDVEDIVQDVHRAVRVDVPSHQHDFIKILSLPEMHHPEKVVSTWTELALQAVLKHTQLDSETVRAAKELVVDSLSCLDDASYVTDYRKRVFQLYLLDALSDASGPDAVDSAAMDEAEKESKKTWKANLADVLISFALRRPEQFCHAANVAFSYPTSRLELLNLFQQLAGRDTLDSVVFASSDLMSSILLSLTVDNSTSCFTLGVGVIVEIIPSLAIASHEVLVQRVAWLFVILARALSSNGLHRADDSAHVLQYGEDGEDDDLGSSWPDSAGVHFQRKSLTVDPDLSWHRLEPSFVPISSRLPKVDHLFTFLYGIFPCNTIEFLRHPTKFIEDRHVRCPFTAGWRDVLDDDEIRQRGSVLACRHTLPANFINHDINSELSDHKQWSDREVSGLIAEVISLDSASASASSRPPRILNVPDGEGDNLDADPSSQIIDFTVPHRPRISVRSMIAATMALKSSTDIEVVDYPLHWPAEVLAINTVSRTSRSASVGSYARSVSNHDVVDIPADAASIAANSSDGGNDLHTRAVAILQRECLLLRNELNYQLWLKRSLLDNVARLQRERNSSILGELERQNLRAKGKEYQAQKEDLQAQLKRERANVTHAQKNYKEEADLHSAKRKEMRDKKKEWEERTATLSQTNKENEARLKAQSERLAESVQRIFALESREKETAPLIARLEDYQTRIEQHTKMQKLWDEDLRRFRAQNAQVDVMVSNYKKREEELASVQEANKKLREERTESLDKISALERKLEQVSASLPQASTSAIPSAAHQVRGLAKELSDAKAACKKLRAENAQLRDQMEELESSRELSRTPSRT